MVPTGPHSKINRPILIFTIILLVVLSAVAYVWVTDPIYHLPDRPLTQSEVEKICQEKLQRVAKRNGIKYESFRLVYIEHNNSQYVDNEWWVFYYFSEQHPEFVHSVNWMEDSRRVDYLPVNKTEFLKRQGHKLKSNDYIYLTK